MAGSGDRSFSYIRRGGQKMEASTMWGNKVRNWDDPSFAQKTKGRIFHRLEKCDLEFSIVLTMDADPKHWDSLRKYLGSQPRIRVANPRRGESPKFHVLLTKEPPKEHGRLIFTVKNLQSKEEIFSFLREHLVADNPKDIVKGDHPFNKYSTNVEELKLRKNRSESDRDSEWEVFAGSPSAFGKYAQGRGAEVKITDDKKYMYAEFPEGHDQFKFQFLPGWPSGNDQIDGEYEPESEVAND